MVVSTRVGCEGAACAAGACCCWRSWLSRICAAPWSSRAAFVATGAPEGDSAVATELVRKVKPPQLYKVLLHNDDYTTMEFVVMVLMSVFRHSEPEAVQIMLSVHQKGSGVAGIFSREIAETKADKVTRLARENEYPLKCSVEPA